MFSVFSIRFYDEKFWQRHRGLGLLRISYGIIKEHAGKVDVRVDAGKRSTSFRLRIPRSQESALHHA